MREFNQRFEGLNDTQKQARYQQLALVCLAHYPTIDGKVTFIGHNVGIVYQIETSEGKFLLKIAEPTGEGENLTKPEYIRNCLLWLSALAQDTGLIIQQPIANHLGDFVTAVIYDDLRQPFYCTIQRWLAGQPLRGPTTKQMGQVGEMIAQLHNHGSQWIKGKSVKGWTYDDAFQQENLEAFARVKSLDILSAAEWATVEKSVDHIQQMIQTLGTDHQVWGPIHGDLHHQNLLVLEDGTISPIDFDSLILAYYGYDLGVTLYHTMYMDAEDRQALVAGYQVHRPLTSLPDMALEAFLCMAALANLAFQVGLPDQRESALFIRNVREFAAVYCDKLIHDVPFALEHHIPLS